MQVLALYTANPLVELRFHKGIRCIFAQSEIKRTPACAGAIQDEQLLI